MDTTNSGISPSGDNKPAKKPNKPAPDDAFASLALPATDASPDASPKKFTEEPTEKKEPAAKKDPTEANPPTDAWASLALPASPSPRKEAPLPRNDSEPAKTPVFRQVQDSDTDPKVPSPAPQATGSFRAEPSGIARTPVPPPPPSSSKLPAVEGYELLGVLGRGGMGVVYKARHIKLKRLVALKMILGGARAGDEDMLRFRTEAEAVARLQHPHIVQIYEIGAQDGQPFFSLEFIDGGSLDRKVGGKPQPLLEATSLMATLADAVHFAHQQGILHRDLKPANILLTKSGEPKITDFGLAKQMDGAQGQTETGSIMGTPAYMPPEQAQGDTRNLGPAADIYSLGAIMYELLTGAPPFKGETAMDTLLQVQMTEPTRPGKLRPRLPRDLETICLKCLEKSPCRRYATAGDLADDLRRFLNHEPIVARPVSTWERGVKWLRRHPAGAACLALLGLLILGSGGALAAYGVHQAQELQRHASARKRVDEQVLRAQEAEKNEAWTGARDLLLSAAEECRDESELAEESTAIQEKLDRVQSRLQALARLRDFAQYRDEAVFHATLAGGETEGNAEQARTSATKALDAVALKLDSLWVPDAAFTPEEQADVRRGSYELLLTLAEVIARRSANAPLAARQDGAREGLRVLDGAARLGFETRAYHLRRSRFLATLGDAQAAERESKLAGECPTRTARDHYLVGEEHYQRGDVPAARAEFEESLRVEGDGFWASYFLALCHVKLGQPRLALEPLNFCLARKQGLAWIYLLRGFVHGQLGKYPAAEGDFSEVMARDPSPDVLYVLYNNRAVMRVGQKNFDEASIDLKQAIKLKPDQYQAYASLAQVEFVQGRSDDAVAAMNQAVHAAQTLLERGAIDAGMLGLLYRARSRYQLGRKDVPAALADLDRALALEAADSLTVPTLQGERGRLLHRLQDYSEAIVAYSAALKTPQPNPEIHRWKAEALIAAQRYPEVVQAFSEYSRLGGVLGVKDYQLLALAHHKTGDLRATIDDLTKVLETESNNAEVLGQRAQVYLVVRAYTLAARDFDRALALTPDDAALYEGRGFALAKLGQHQKATKDVEESWRRSAHTSQQAFRAARTFAQAAAQVDIDRMPADSPAVKTRRTYEERSLALLREALQKLPQKERVTFWSETVRNDPELNPLHRTTGYAELERKYTNPSVAP
jgi:tetratricopeptide (TPR) repeat protein/tRNA A-37 threonylcarbamoyl transferase component Bud32